MISLSGFDSKICIQNCAVLKQFPGRALHLDGALGHYISDGSIESFQPMNVNFSIISPLEQRIRKKAEKNLAIANRALEAVDALVAAGI